MKEKFDIVCDIETLGTESNHLVWEIAACVYKRNNKELVSYFHETLDISKLKNVEISGSTLVWWLKTNKELLADKLSNTTLNQPKEEKELFTDFYDWLIDIIIDITDEIFKDSTDFIADNLYFWGNGILFDNRFIKDKFEHYGLNYPILYRNDRDIRTLIELAADKTDCKSNSEFMKKYVLENTTLHDAFDDVRNEYESMKAAWKVLGLYLSED